MKKTILIVLISIIIHVTFASVLFYDDFNREEGSTVGNDWVNIGPVNPIIESGSLKLTSSSLMGVKREFNYLEITSGVYFISYDWKITSNNWLADAFPNSNITYLRHDYEGNLYYDNTSDFSNPMNIGNLPLNTWVNIKLRIDIDNNQFSIWIDDNLIVENISGNFVDDFTRFTFRAGNGSTVTQYVDNFIIFDETSPAVPSNFSVVGFVNDIILSWEISTDPFLNYYIYRRTSQESNELVAILPSNQTEYSDSSVESYTNYFYTIKAVSILGFESELSTAVSASLQPQIEISPSSVNLEVGYGFDTEFPFSISNTGNNNLDFTIIANNNSLFGDGLDGELHVPVGTSLLIDDIKSPVMGENLVGNNSIYVNNPDGFMINNEILIITMQNNDSVPGEIEVGNYQFNKIVSINGFELFLADPLLYNFTQSNLSKHQVLKVNNFSNVLVEGSVTCSQWDGFTGGVLCFKSSNSIIVTETGNISSTGNGYKGGASQFWRISYDGNPYGYSGESVSGQSTRSQNSNYGGGGGGRAFPNPGGTGAPGGGGGGGGYGTMGGLGGTHWMTPLPGGYGGEVYGSSLLDKLFMGSGGGSGYTPNSQICNAGAGGDGGGILMLFTPEISNCGTIESNGDNGISSGQYTAPYYDHSGGGGGGSGGSIVLTTFNITNNGNISCRGGIGGAGAVSTFFGGDGGVGRISITGDLTDNNILQPSPLHISSSPFINPMTHVSQITGSLDINENTEVLVTYLSSTFNVGNHIDTLYVFSNDNNNSQSFIIIDISILPPIPTIDNENKNLVFNIENSTNLINVKNQGDGKLFYSISSGLLNVEPSVSIIEPHSEDFLTVSLPEDYITDFLDTSVIIQAQGMNEIFEFELNLSIDFSAPLSPSLLHFNESLSDMHQTYISWQENAIADSVYSYNIYRKGIHDQDWLLKGSVNSSQTWFIDDQFTGLDTTAVNYRVTAVDWVGNESEPSQEVLAWLQRFEAPAGLELQIINNRHVKLDWTPVTQTLSGNEGNPACYVIYRSEYPSPVESFYFVAAVEENTFTHQWAAWFNEENKLYYIVTAYGGDFEDIIRYTSKDSVIQYGNLDSYIRNKKINNQGEFRKDISINNVKK